MRPVRLTFAGLRSYRSETTVDFSALDLFAVIGDTGAGKSTLIEALSLALYARKSWSGGGTSLTDLISDGMNTMRIELTFAAGGHEWTVTRARHRNSSAPIDKLVSSTAAGADGAANVTRRIEEIVGLTHEQFTRAVVLPQGRFDSLLRATEAERNKILASILDLGDVVATRKQAERLVEEWRPRVVEWSTLRSTLPADPASALASAEQAAEQAAALHDRLTAAAEAAAGLDADRTRLLDLHAELRSAIDSTPRAPDGVVGLLRAGADQWQDTAARLAVSSAASAEAESREVELRQQIVEALHGFESRDALVAAASGARRAAAELPAAFESVTAAEAELDRLAASAPNSDVAAELVSASEAAAAALEAAERQVVESDESARAAVGALDRWQAAAAVVASRTAELQAAEDALAGLDPEADARREELAAAEAAQVAARHAQHAALVADAAATAGAGCRAGDDCPVCARPLPEHYVPPQVSGDVVAASDAATEAERRVQRASARVNEIAEQRAGRLTSLRHAREAADAAAAEEAEARQAATALGLHVEAPRTEALSALDTARVVAVERRDTARAAAVAASEALAEARGAAAGAVAAHRTAVESATAQLQRCEAEVAKLRAALAPLPATWWEPAGELTARQLPALDATVARLDASASTLAALDESVAAAVAARSAADVEVATLSSLLHDRVVPDVGRHLAAATARIAGAQALGAVGEAASRLLGADVADLADVTDLAVVASHAAPVIDFPDGADALAASIDEVEQALADADAIERSARLTLDLITAEGTKLRQRLTEVLDPLGCDSLATLHQHMGRAAAERRAAADAVALAGAHAADAQRLDAHLVVARPFVANLDVLREALRDVNFVAHLVDAREQELLVEATRRLKDITGGRFGFVSDFGVVDVRSGEVRSPDSLSGGERFQAALALALALVEIASRGGGKLDAVFVDEGFGSLDSRSLDVALETLGLVAGDGKMVALISHLRPVAEYVDTVLHVTKDDMFGSRITLLDGDALEAMIEDDTRSGLTA